MIKISFFFFFFFFLLHAGVQVPDSWLYSDVIPGTPQFVGSDADWSVPKCLVPGVPHHQRAHPQLLWTEARAHRVTSQLAHFKATGHRVGKVKDLIVGQEWDEATE